MTVRPINLEQRMTPDTMGTLGDLWKTDHDPLGLVAALGKVRFRDMLELYLPNVGVCRVISPPEGPPAFLPVPVSGVPQSVSTVIVVGNAAAPLNRNVQSALAIGEASEVWSEAKTTWHLVDGAAVSLVHNIRNIMSCSEPCGKLILVDALRVTDTTDTGGRRFLTFSQRFAFAVWAHEQRRVAQSVAFQ